MLGADSAVDAYIFGAVGSADCASVFVCSAHALPQCHGCLWLNQTWPKHISLLHSPAVRHRNGRFEFFISDIVPEVVPCQAEHAHLMVRDVG